MLAINMDDVINVLNSCKPYLIALGIALAIAIIVTVACMKLKKPVKKLVRKEAWIAFLMAAVVIINLICFIPMSSMISLAMGNGTITEETSNEATALCEDIADEGIVLLKNEDNILPLTNTQNINVFGWASTNPCYGGTGSGALSDAYETTTLLGGLEDAGYKINTELTDFYKAYREDRPEVGMWAQDWTLPEPTADSYSDELINNAKEFSDTAMVVITRVGGEGADLPTDVSKVTYTDNSENYKDFEAGEHYLQLSQTEKDMLDLVCANFDNVVVVYNGANTMELGFLNDYKQIKGAIWCPGTGQSGFESLGAVVAGTVNPSGKTSDTFVYDLTATPTYNNFGNFLYDNMDEFAATSKNFGTGEEEATIPSFVNYVEGIYVGYRFYETAAVEGLIDYDKTVQFPFGYGLSYTDFEQKMGDVTVADGKVSFDVTVTNNGTAAGKDVVEVYYNPPYTNGGIEKASANLIDFAKTDVLQPGESQTINVSFSEEDMASYDTYGNGCYVLEAGDYEISINSDSHNAIASQTVSVADTVVYDENNARSTDDAAATNQFRLSIGTTSCKLDVHIRVKISCDFLPCNNCHTAAGNLRIFRYHSLQKNFVHFRVNPIVRVHKSNIVAMHSIQSSVSGRRHTAVLFTNHDNSGILQSKGFAQLPASVAGSVIHQNNLQIPIGLRTDTGNTFSEILFRIIDRHDNRNQRFGHLISPHYSALCRFSQKQ